MPSFTVGWRSDGKEEEPRKKQAKGNSKTGNGGWLRKRFQVTGTRSRLKIPYFVRGLPHSVLG